MTNFDGVSFEQKMLETMQNIPIRADLASSAAAFMKDIGLTILDTGLSNATSRFWNKLTPPVAPSIHSFACETSRQIDLEEWVRELSPDWSERFAGRVLLPNHVEVEFRDQSVRYSISRASLEEHAFTDISLVLTKPWDVRGAHWESVIRIDEGSEVEEDARLVVLPLDGKMTRANNDALGFVIGGIETVLRGASFTRIEE